MIATLYHCTSSRAAGAWSALALFACLLTGSCGNKQEPPAADAVDLPDPGIHQDSIAEDPGSADAPAPDGAAAGDATPDQPVSDSNAIDGDSPADAPQDAGSGLDGAVLPDAIAPEVADDADSEAQDIPDTVPADIGSDTTGVCADPNLIVEPTTLPDGSTCSQPCPPPYPCVCGVCPWLQTPKLTEPRYNHRAVWTGTEVLVIGGTNNTFDIYDMTGERWNPTSGKGFEKLPWPKFKLSGSGVVGASANWTGSEVIVHWANDPYQSFRFNPQTNDLKFISGKNRPYYNEAHAVWAGGRLFHWGGIAATAKLGLYDPTTDTWETVPQPSSMLPAEWPNLPGSPCTVASGDDVFIFDVAHWWSDGLGNPPIWPNGQDAGKEAVSLRFHVPTKTFSYVAWPMPAKLRCSGSSAPAAGFPDGFMVWGKNPKFAGDAGAPTAGAVYWKKTNTWTKIAASAPAYSGYVRLLWVGGRFAVFGANFANPKKDPDPPWPPAWPRLFDPYTNSWSDTTPMGAPNDERGGVGIAYTGSELLMLGGSDGPGGAQMLHADGVRLHLPPTNKEVQP